MCQPYSYIIYITLHDYTLTRILHWLLCRDCGFAGFICINQISYIIEEPYYCKLLKDKHCFGHYTIHIAVSNLCLCIIN